MLDGVDLFDDIITEQQRFRPKVGAKLGKRPKSSKVGSVKAVPCDVAPSKQCEASDAAAGTTVTADETTTEAKEKMIPAELPIDTGALENHLEIDVPHGITEGSLGNALDDACKINGDVDNEKSVEPDEVNTHGMATEGSVDVFGASEVVEAHKVKFRPKMPLKLLKSSKIAAKCSGSNLEAMELDGMDTNQMLTESVQTPVRASLEKPSSVACMEKLQCAVTVHAENSQDFSRELLSSIPEVQPEVSASFDEVAIESHGEKCISDPTAGCTSTSDMDPTSQSYQKEDSTVCNTNKEVLKSKGPTYSVEVNDDGHDAGNNKVSKRSNREKDSNALSSKRKRTSKKSPSQKEASKKLPHRVSQKRRQVDKHLLDMPEEEIDRIRITIKNLILYAEAKERKWSKDPSTRALNGASSSGRRKNKSCDDLFGYADERRDDEDAVDLKSSVKLNYHSHSNISRSRWTQPETDLFYQAIRYLGTDFTMIQYLFPGKEPEQIKRKFKNEEKKFPYKVQEALVHRPTTDLSHYYKKVIELMRNVNSKKSTADEETGTAEEFGSAGNDDYGIENKNAGMFHKDGLEGSQEWQENVQYSESYDGVDDHKQDSTVAPDFDSFFD